jgi:hypothetical protein
VIAVDGPRLDEAFFISASRRLHRAGKDHGIERLSEGGIVGTGISLFFIATGAILTFAVEARGTDGFNLDAAGVILMVIGGLGLLWSLVVWEDWRPWGGPRYDDDVIVRRDYVADEPVIRRSAVLVDDEVPLQRTVRRVYH